MALVMSADGIRFSDGTTRSNRPLTIFATATLVSSINNVNAAQIDYVNIPISGSENSKGLPAVTWTFDYWTYWQPGTVYPFTSFVNVIERHFNSSSGSYIRIGIYHGAWGGPHAYTIQCVGNYF